MRLLDLYCGAGGAASGYMRAGFHVTGVDMKAQPRYCGDAFVQGDALTYLAAHGHEYDLIHASPPCQRYSRETPPTHKARHSDDLEVLTRILRAGTQPYVIENVEDARRHLDNPLLLCGTMFGLRIWRHRRFEIRPPLSALLPQCQHEGIPVLITGTQKGYGRPNKEYSVQERRDAIGCPWMTDTDLDNAVPPAYTHWIGTHLLRTLAPAVRATTKEEP